MSNRNGYMLVEIIVASVIAFAIVYFIISLTIKLKNRNDDVLVESVVATDSTIVNNKLMEYARTSKEEFKCDDLSIDNNKVMYQKKVIDVFTEYAKLGKIECTNQSGEINVSIDVDVKQMPEKDFDINVNYKYKIEDYAYPKIEVFVPEGNVYKKEHVATVTVSDNDGLQGGTIKINYDWSGGAAINSCDKMSNSETLMIPNMAKEVKLQIPVNGKTGDGKIYVCNYDTLIDMHGNKLGAYVVSHVMKLDNTGPVMTYGLADSMTATVTCEDKNAGMAEPFDKVVSLSGTQDVTLNNTCQDKLGNPTTQSHKYIYSDCATGSPGGCNSCAGAQCRETLACNIYMCDYVSSCIQYSYACPPCWPDTCKKGFKLN